MPTFARTREPAPPARARRPALPLRALPAALVFAAASLAARRAQADPERPYAQWHLDIYELHFGGADLRSIPINTSVGTLTGRDIGVTGVETLGAPLVAPHLGLGVEIPRALFYLHGGATFLGRGTGEPARGDYAYLLFAQLTAAPRLSLGRFVLSLGPSVGFRYLTGGQAGGWNTNVQPTLGGELDARVRILAGGGGRRHLPPNMTADFFVHVTASAFEGASWMVALGHGFGSLPGR